jgi:uncharacterized protein
VAAVGPDQGGERWLGPSERFLAMRRTEVGVAVVIAALVLVAPARSASMAGVAALYAALVLVGIAGEWYVGRRFRSWGYCERSRDLLVKRGVLVRRLTVVPYGRMQLVDVTAGAAERVFGLATIRMHTAAAATDARIPGLPPDEAKRLRDQLAALGESQAAGV